MKPVSIKQTVQVSVCQMSLSITLIVQTIEVVVHYVYDIN